MFLNQIINHCKLQRLLFTSRSMTFSSTGRQMMARVDNMCRRKSSKSFKTSKKRGVFNWVVLGAHREVTMNQDTTKILIQFKIEPSRKTKKKTSKQATRLSCKNISETLIMEVEWSNYIRAVAFRTVKSRSWMTKKRTILVIECLILTLVMAALLV